MLLLFTGALTTAGTASAADCPSGEFCVWENAEFSGRRANWSGDDGWWESWIADGDSSWANHGISGPGIKDHVKVYSSAGQGGQPTACSLLAARCSVRAVPGSAPATRCPYPATGFLARSDSSWTSRESREATERPASAGWRSTLSGSMR